MRMIKRAAALAVAAVTCTAGTAAATTGPSHGPDGVGEVVYNLGDTAFRPPAEIGYEGTNELAGTVYYPRDLGRGVHPLIVVEHGSWQTCADREATDANEAAQRALEEAQRKGDTAEAERQEKILEETGALMWRWPCAGTTPRLPSLNGYAYLGRKLAERGFVVVSIGTNGINATAAGQADTVYYARAALINAHLAMWRRLSSTGTGPLRGEFKDPRTHAPRDVGFAGHVDLSDVGTIGHSMGGGGVMQQVADQRHTEWPKGVTIRAAFTLAPTDNWNEEIVTKVPFAVMWGTCDQVNTGHYFEDSAGRNRAPLYRYTLTGGNHDNYNTEWSPSGGQVGSRDDAVPGSRPGTCRTQFPDGPQTDTPELTETRQRALTSAYVIAFFQRHLNGRKEFDPFLTGRRHPKDVAVRYEGAHP